MQTLDEILKGLLASDFEIVLSKPHLALLVLINYHLQNTQDYHQNIAETELLSLFEAIDRLEAKDLGGSQLRARGAVNALQKSGIIVRADCGGLSAIEPIFSAYDQNRARPE